MDFNSLGLFIKMLQEEYGISEAEKRTLTHRMMADAAEFEKIWKLYRSKPKTIASGEDPFRSVLSELLS